MCFGAHSTMLHRHPTHHNAGESTAVHGGFYNNHEGSNCAQLDLRSDLRSGLRFGRGWICGWVCGWASGVPAVGRGWVAVLLRFVVAVSLELQSN